MMMNGRKTIDRQTKWCQSFVVVILCLFLSIVPIYALDGNTDKPKAEGNKAKYYIGTGIYDITGPAAQINLMGYAKATQTAHGIHMRLRARAFIVSERPHKDEQQMENKSTMDNEQAAKETETTSSSSSSSSRTKSRLRWDSLFSHNNEETTTKVSSTDEDIKSSNVAKLDPERTICFVSIDTGMGSDLLNMKVLKRLDDLLPQQAHGGKRLCHLENLSISGTHTHSAPAGFIQYTLYQITSAGFSNEVMDTYVEGIAQSILRAFIDLDKGNVHMAKTMLYDANINRSPTSYLLNPPDELDMYAEEGDTDKTFLQLNFIDEKNAIPKGIVNWFPVHGTSMNVTNTFISGDNKGYASYVMEKFVNGNETLPGKGNFVAAFASTNLGDVSPNTNGPRCQDTGKPCDLFSSTCGGKNALCIASGPGKDMKESTKIIGYKQYETALSLLQNTSAEVLSGRVDFRHSFIDMSNLNVTLENGDTVKTCPAALGYAFAAGTTDGPGCFDFRQGQNTSNPFWNMVSGFLSIPTEEQKRCHAPKPILLNTGNAKLPYTWDPNEVPISVFRVGRFFILSVPCEFTTMAGRRLRRSVRELLEARGVQSPEVTIAGLANSYTHYVTTFEEYHGQRYEAASTLYGPHTLSAYIQEFKRIAADLIDGKKSHGGTGPSDLSNRQISLLPPVVVDTIGFGKKFGSVAIDAHSSYIRGDDKVLVSFRSANPRNNQRIEDTFLTVDQLQDDGTWKTLHVDGDWSTTYYWKSSIETFGSSFAEITWEIPEETPQGLYRICHFGTRKTILSAMESAILHAPDWWSFDGFGSIAAGMALQSFKLLLRTYEKARWLLTGLDNLTRTRDFSGCSSSFLVRSKN